MKAPGVSPVHPVERVLARTRRVDRGHTTACLIFTGQVKPDGYGVIRVGSALDDSRRNAPTHRVIYEHCYGPVPAGMVVDHLCRQRDCCEITHLEAVTTRENLRRGVGPSAANARKTHCDKGHEFTEVNTYLDSRGSRHCRACGRDRARARQEAAG